jgi:hypothetical protein
MNRRILAAGFIAVAFFSAAGCDGSGCCLQCPPVDPDGSRAIDVLVATALAYPQMAGVIPGPLLDTGLLPAGSTVDTFSLLDSSRRLVVPSPGLLRNYDALLVFTDAWPADDPGPGAFDTIGGLLADYVDAGGGLVMCEFMICGLSAGIRGRLVSPGYAPLAGGYLETGLDPEADRSIAMESIAFPLHPVFYGIAVDRLVLPGDFAVGRPELDETATLLAVDDRGSNSVAVNADGSIIGLNMYFKAFAFPEDYTETVRLAANSLLYVAGRDTGVLHHTLSP